MKNSRIVNMLLVGSVAVLAFGVGIWLGHKQEESGSQQVLLQDRVITVLPKSKSLQPFALTSATNEPFTLESLQSKYTILFFGYTFCPDICPTTLKELGDLYPLLEQRKIQNDVQVVFVSVDPKRDTADVIRKYVNYFHKDILGVTGSAQQIAGLAKQLGAAYEVLDDGKTENYPVNHTGLLFITNPDSRFAAILSPPHDPELIASRLDLLMKLER